MSPRLSPLHALAAELGVATTYDDYLRRPVAVADPAVRSALAAMGVAADDDDAARASLAALRRDRAARRLPPCTVLRPGDDRSVTAAGAATLLAEDGTRRQLRADRGRVVVPDDLPDGYHQLQSGDETATLIVTPGVCPLPLQAPGFGWMAQLYATRSNASWGIGDCRDLADLATWSGGVGAAMVLINPLHAPAPVLPQEASPYSPTSRRFRNPLYLRIEDLPGADRLPAAGAEELGRLAEQARNASAHRIDYDAVFAAKVRAFELVAAVAPLDDPQFARWRAARAQGLEDFATFCVLAEEHGVPWQSWPADLRHPSSPAVARFRDAHRDRITFHEWLQWACDEQLGAAQLAATDAGMQVGIIHDLAVGVNAGGADAWALQDDLAGGVTVGAPPDGFNQRGQDWGLPPLLPHRLADSGYAPFKDMLRSVLSSAGGIRIDHILGLWRLWWVPQEGSPADGTYVRYPARDLLGVLALEAQRAGALVVGEDLGTVEEGVREALDEHQILSSRVLYFEHVDDDPDEPLLPAADYPERALVSISTHDLPTAAGWWADEEIRVQAQLDLFGESTTPAAEADRKAGERAAMLALLRNEGLVAEDASDDDLAVAMHAFLARTPALLVAASMGDALGDLRQPNMPGTTDQYPNWRLPLADATGEPVGLEGFTRSRRVRSIAALLSRGT